MLIQESAVRRRARPTPRIVSVAVLAAVSITALAPLAAQDARSIFSVLSTDGRVVASDADARGSLTDRDLVDAQGNPVQVWRLEATPGQFVRVDLRSEDFDPYLRLVGPGLGPESADDDGGDGLDSRLCVAVPAGETRVVVSALDQGTGTFSLSVRPAAASDAGCAGAESSPADSADIADLPVEDRRIAVGQTAEGMLFDNDPVVRNSPAQAWALNGVAGESLTVDLRSNDFDAYLMVVGPGLDPLTNDDGAGRCDSRLTVTLPESGMYRVVVSAIGATGGAFRLAASRDPGSVSAGSCDMVSSAASSDAGELDRIVRRGEIPLGSAVEGRITEDDVTYDDRPVQAWSVAGRAGMRLEISMTSSDDMDGVLYFTGPGFDDPLFNDDGGDGLDPLLCIELSETGSYGVFAGRLANDNGSRYRLSVAPATDGGMCSNFDVSSERLQAAYLTLPTEGRALSLGETLEGTLTDDDARLPGRDEEERVQAWRLNAPPGATVWIDLLSDDFDPVLEIAGPSIEEIERNDDYADQGWNSRLEITVPDDGQVMIIVEPYSASDRGAFRLRATTDPPALEVNAGGGGGSTSIADRLEPEAAAAVAALTSDPGRVLEIGVEADGELEDDDVVLDSEHRTQAWTFEGAAGDRVVFEMTAEGFDPIVYLAGPGLGAPLVDDDSGPGTNARLDVVLTESGTYRVYAGALSEATGPFQLRVLRRRP